MSTRVQPLWPGGQTVRPFRAAGGFVRRGVVFAGLVFVVVVVFAVGVVRARVVVFAIVGSGAVGSVVDLPVVVVAVVAVVAVEVAPPLLPRGEATYVEPPPAFPPVTAIATPAPAAATQKVSADVQIQSPGYQPKRRIQRRRSTGMTPLTGGRRRPHSTQYSWRGSR